jgi:16S rRNA G966 N2-methylase RsmD
MATMQLIISPEYDRLVFRQDEKTYSELFKSISENGQYHPIIINPKGVILDGHHRYRICQELELTPKVEVKEFESDLYEKLFVVDSNLNRRHLNDYQRAKLALWAKPILEELARKRMLAGKKGDPPQTLGEGQTGEVNQQIGERAKLSAETIRKAELIIKYKDSLPEEIQEKLETGKTTINAVFSELKKKAAKQKILSQKTRRVANVQLFNGDFIEESDKHIQQNSIDLIFTDPPYDKKSIPLYGKLGALAEWGLKPGGSLVCYAPNYELPTVLELLTQGELRYWWQICVKHSGGHAHMKQRFVFVHWKPLLWFVKGTLSQASDSIDDYIKSMPPDKLLHPWQQSTIEAENVIKKLTIGPQQIVLDPFMGSGTTGIAARKLNRKFIGIEKDRDMFEIARREISSS